MEIYNSKKYTYISKYFRDKNGLEIFIWANLDGYNIIIKDEPITDWVRVKGEAKENFEIAYKIVNEKYDITPISDKEKLLEYFEEIQEPNTAINRMGCSESWYDPFYAIKQTFTKEEIREMDKDEINDLFRLAVAIQDALY